MEFTGENIYPIWELAKEIIFSEKDRTLGVYNLHNFCTANKSLNIILCNNEEFWKSLIKDDLKYLGITDISQVPKEFLKMKNPFRKFYLWTVAYGGKDKSELKSGFFDLLEILCTNPWFKRNICDNSTFWKMASRDFISLNFDEDEDFEDIDFTSLDSMILPEEYDSWFDFYSMLMYKITINSNEEQESAYDELERDWLERRYYD